MTELTDYAKYREVKLSAVHPDGWLKRYLQIQKDGLTGHMEVSGFPFNTVGWGGDKVDHIYGGAWWPYEQTGYWVDGAIRCAHLLRDKDLIEKAGKQIEFVLDHADDDGYLGPDFLKPELGDGRWPHAVFFRAMAAHYLATGDERIPQAIAKHYLTESDPHSKARNVVNVESMLWAYHETGDKRLLDLAVKAYEEYNRIHPEQDTTVENMLSDRVSTEHGVTFNEQAKLGAIMYMSTGEKKYLDATINAYRKIDRDSMLVDGLHSCTEHLRGKDPLDSHETCDIADFTWSTGYLLMATGSAEYADKIERAIFNAAVGANRYDFKGLQYFSCPNQVVCDRFSNHNAFHIAQTWMSYRPNPGTECCAGETNRIMPNYVARMWMRGADGALVAALYGPGSITTQVGAESSAVTVTEKTNYPFSEQIDFQISCDGTVRFPFVLRIPGWCSQARVQINGQALDIQTDPGTFITIDREFSDGDVIALSLPMALKLTEWGTGGIAIERGPIVYALRIEEDWKIDQEDQRSTKDFPAYNLYSASPWNYALEVNHDNLEEVVEVVEREYADEPWSLDNAPIELKVPARKVKNWDLDRVSCLESRHTGHIEGKIMFTPPIPNPHLLPDRLSEEVETVTLVPYGCTHVRMTIFPQTNKA